MSCEKIRNQITWYLYNELDEASRGSVEDHIEGCAACATELEKERGLLATLNARPALDPSPNLLADCRLTLLRSLDREPARTLKPWEALREAWFSMRAWRPAAATLVLAAGFLGGWLAREVRRPAALQPGMPNEASIGSISAVQLDPTDGDVEISFDEVRRQTLSGRMQDPRIQNFLLRAASSYSNPGVRLDSIDILGQQADDQQVRNTLLRLVRQDPNDGVRLKALESLKAHAQEPEVRQALIDVLNRDGNPGMRVQAIDLLMQARGSDLVGVFQGVAAREPNNYVRMRCRSALRDMNASVETF